jgi:hypothetical protein
LSRISPDDTPVLDRDDPRAVCKGRIWTYLGDYDQIGFCEYTKTWEREARARSCGRRNDALGGDEYAARGVRVNAICAGVTATPAMRQAEAALPRWFSRWWRSIQ